MVIEEEIKKLEHKQLHWNIFYPNTTIREMMAIHRFIEVAQVASEYIRMNSEEVKINDD